MDRKYLDARTLVDGGYLQEANRQFFHPLGLALALEDGALRVWDCRDDPEGICFADGLPLRAKATHIAVTEGSRYAARKTALGYWVQPLPPAVAKG